MHSWSFALSVPSSHPSDSFTTGADYTHKCIQLHYYHCPTCDYKLSLSRVYSMQLLPETRSAVICCVTFRSCLHLRVYENTNVSKWVNMSALCHMFLHMWHMYSVLKCGCKKKGPHLQWDVGPYESWCYNWIQVHFIWDDFICCMVQYEGGSSWNKSCLTFFVTYCLLPFCTSHLSVFSMQLLNCTIDLSGFLTYFFLWSSAHQR